MRPSFPCPSVHARGDRCQSKQQEWLGSGLASARRSRGELMAGRERASTPGSRTTSKEILHERASRRMPRTDSFVSCAGYEEERAGRARYAFKWQSVSENPMDHHTTAPADENQQTPSKTCGSRSRPKYAMRE